MTQHIISLRKQHILTYNAVYLTYIAIVIALGVWTNIAANHFMMALATLVLIMSIVRIKRIDKTKSFIPIFEKIKKHEHSQLGVTWERDHLFINIGLIIVFIFLILQSFAVHSGGISFQEDPSLLTIFLLLGIILNVVNYTRLKKVEKNATPEQIKQIQNALKLPIATSIIIYTIIITAFTMLN
ncbi:hypothetical protein [Bacillus sp. FJAT-45066]|uniref:hypothetical protein n=1 Tax=Bacillus sp. FJAT-45066 TaxID=2011010 RepID=UPI000BB7B9E8|nr:hypothetical protein [Bacillus sp. FJAT-45066]